MVSVSLIARLISVALVFLCSVVFARGLGPEGFGVYSYFFATATIGASLLQLGFPGVVVKAFGGMSVSDQVLVAKTTFEFQLVFSGLCATSLLVAWYGIPRDDFRWTAFAIIATWAMVLTAISSAFAASQKLIIKSLFPAELFRPACLILLFGGYVAFISDDINENVAINLFLTSVLLTLFLAKTCLPKMRPNFMREDTSTAYKSRKDVIYTLFGLGFISATQMIARQIDVLALGFLGYAEGAGIYRIALQFAMFSALAHQATNTIAQVQFSNAIHEMNPAVASQALQRTCSISFYSAAVCFLLFAGFGSQIIALLFGMEYKMAYEPALVLFASFTIKGLIGHGIQFMIMNSRARLASVCVIFSEIIHILMLVKLLKTFGERGAAYSVLLGTIVLALLVVFVIRKQFGIWALPLRI